MTGTEDLFTPVHKGLRSMLYGLSGRLQTNDFADVTATSQLAADLENNFAVAQSAGCILCHLATHAHEEETVIFPGAAKFANELVSSLIADHHELTRRETEIAKSAHEMVGLATPDARIAAGIRLNQMSNELLGLYITHMNREETELVPLMRERYSDPEQLAMQGTIIASFPPDRLFALLRWMLPSMNVNELSHVLGSVKRGAPPPLFKAVTDLCSQTVDPARWAVVRARIGLS